jgi:hypothetical protein
LPLSNSSLFRIEEILLVGLRSSWRTHTVIKSRKALSKSFLLSGFIFQSMLEVEQTSVSRSSSRNK